MDLMDLAAKMGHEKVVYCQDKDSELKAIIAIHSTVLGPALGGCRFWNYASASEAMFDVLRLSRGMTYKASITGLPLGGGKAVIIGDPARIKSPALLQSFGRFVDSLQGYYITAEDVNIRVEDMEIVAQETQFVTGITSRSGGSGDPSPVTAFGVFQGIKAAVNYRFKQKQLKGMHVAVQGCGAVGRNLIELLHDAGAVLTISDINHDLVTKVAGKFNAKIVSPEKTHSVVCDVFAPCALGGILNEKTIPQVKAKIIAGGANNQLLDEERDGQDLMKRNILYAPDYIINAGGLINVTYELKGYQAEKAKSQTEDIYKTLIEVFELAEERNIMPQEASNLIAEERIMTQKKKNNHSILQNSFNNQPWIKV